MAESTIRSCFRHCGFEVPSGTLDATAAVAAPDAGAADDDDEEENVQQVADLLECLQEQNIVTDGIPVDEYLGVDDAEDICTMASDEDILLSLSRGDAAEDGEEEDDEEVQVIERVSLTDALRGLETVRLYLEQAQASPSSGHGFELASGLRQHVLSDDVEVLPTAANSDHGDDRVVYCVELDPSEVAEDLGAGNAAAADTAPEQADPSTPPARIVQRTWASPQEQQEQQFLAGFAEL